MSVGGLNSGKRLGSQGEGGNGVVVADDTRWQNLVGKG